MVRDNIGYIIQVETCFCDTGVEAGEDVVFVEYHNLIDDGIGPTARNTSFYHVVDSRSSGFDDFFFTDFVSARKFRTELKKNRCS